MIDYLVKMWRDTKGRASAFATDNSLEEVGMSAISIIGSGSYTTLDDGRTELRPTWGMRLGMPALAAFVFFTIDPDLIFGWLPLLGFGPNAVHWAMVLLGWGLMFATISLNFFQRVAYDGDTIHCEGTNLRHQTRDLSGLVDIEVHEKRPVLMLTFSDQAHLYIPKYISQREAFLADMDAIIERNLDAGQDVPDEDGLFQRLGL
ncbi:MAG: hypothetical protein AAFN94_13155 [Pseudomonadota bacterium]